MKKKLLTTILTVCLLWAVCAGSALAADIKIMLNGQALSFEQAPYTDNGVTMVPMRVIFEALGADVDYDAASQKITAGRGDVTIELTLGQKTAKKNGASLTLDVAAAAKNGSTMVPLRFVAEALGADVNWDGAAQTVSITQETVNTGSSNTSSSSTSSSNTSSQENQTNNTAAVQGNSVLAKLTEENLGNILKNDAKVMDGAEYFTRNGAGGFFFQKNDMYFGFSVYNVDVDGEREQASLYGPGYPYYVSVSGSANCDDKLDFTDDLVYHVLEQLLNEDIVQKVKNESWHLVEEYYEPEPIAYEDNGRQLKLIIKKDILIDTVYWGDEEIFSEPLYQYSYDIIFE